MEITDKGLNTPDHRNCGTGPYLTHRDNIEWKCKGLDTPDHRNRGTGPCPTHRDNIEWKMQRPGYP